MFIKLNKQKKTVIITMYVNFPKNFRNNKIRTHVYFCTGNNVHATYKNYMIFYILCW